ncbi:unnamed protein product [Pylaiella littoralis]
MQLVPRSRDIEGRQARLPTYRHRLKRSSSLPDNKLDRKIRILAVWYVLLAGLEDVETPRRGFCFVAAINSFEFGQVDAKFTKTIKSLQGGVPLRIGSINIC